MRAPPGFIEFQRLLEIVGRRRQEALHLDADLGMLADEGECADLRIGP